MDPLTLVVLAVLALVVLTLVGWVVRAWVRGVIRMIKLVFFLGFSGLMILAIAGAAAWFLYGDQLRAMLG